MSHHTSPASHYSYAEDNPEQNPRYQPHLPATQKQMLPNKTQATDQELEEALEIESLNDKKTQSGCLPPHEDRIQVFCFFLVGQRERVRVPERQRERFFSNPTCI